MYRPSQRPSLRLHLPEEPASGESALEFEGEILEISVPVGDTLNDLGRVVGALEDIGSQADNASGHDAIGSAGEHLDESVYGLELVRLSDGLAQVHNLCRQRASQVLARCRPDFPELGHEEVQVGKQLIRFSQQPQTLLPLRSQQRGVGNDEPLGIFDRPYRNVFFSNRLVALALCGRKRSVLFSGSLNACRTRLVKHVLVEHLHDVEPIVRQLGVR